MSSSLPPWQEPPVVSAEPWLTRLVHHAQAIGHDAEVEAVHQLRVCCARLRVWLSLAEWRVLDDDLRWLRLSAGAVRDLDVQIQSQPPQALLEELLRRRVEAVLQLRQTLNEDRFTALVIALSHLPNVPQSQAYAALKKIARATLKRGEPRHWRRNKEHALHSLRRSVRRTRYALEWVEQDASVFVKLQDALGEVCDRFVSQAQWSEHQADETSAQGGAAYQQRVQTELQQHLDAALKAWKKTRPVLEELSHATVYHSPRHSDSPVGSLG